LDFIKTDSKYKMKAAEIFKKNFGVKTESPYLRTPEKITGVHRC